MVEQPMRVDQPLQAIGWAFLATFCFLGIDALIKHLSGTLHPFFIAQLRMLFGFLIWMPILVPRKFSPMKVSKFRLHLLRGLLGAAGSLASYMGLAMAPFAKVQSLYFTIPIFGVMFGFLLLREVPSRSQVACIALGAVGVFIIVQPDEGILQIGSAIVLVSSIIHGLIAVVIRKMAQTESSLSITIWMNLTVGFFLLPFALPQASMPGWHDMFLVIAMTLCGTAGQYCNARALEIGQASVVLPIEYSKVIWAPLIGWIFFAEDTPVTTVVGALVIISGMMVMTRSAASAK